MGKKTPPSTHSKHNKHKGVTFNSKSKSWSKGKVAPEKRSRKHAQSAAREADDDMIKAPTIYGEIPPAIDQSKLKLSLKQVFFKRDREYPLLPKGVHPKSYTLELFPSLDLFTYKGLLYIVVELKHPVNKIVLNATGVGIATIFPFKTLADAKSSTREDEETKKSLTYSLNNETELLEIDIPKAFNSGTWALKISFTGMIRDQMRGFHYSRYTNLNEQTIFKYLTKCQPCDARRVYPCFDEPEYKATYQVTLTIPKGKIGLANTMEKTSKASKHNKNALKDIEFEETPPMPSFMFCIVVGDFNYIQSSSSKGVKVRVFVPHHAKKQEAKYALNVAVKAIDFMEKIFNQKYALRKMDLVPITEMNIELQCCWGLAVFRQDAILILEKTNDSALIDSPRIFYQRIALLVSRAIAEQWVGNKVTMQWWSDVWLNVGLATFLKYVCVQTLFPAFEVMNQFPYLVTTNALRGDLYKYTHPLTYNLRDPPDIEETYDDITTDKAAAILRMACDFVEPKQFEDGLAKYIETHDKTNAKSAQFWSDVGKGSKHGDLELMMRSWTKFAGYPVVTVEKITSKGEKSEVELKQEMFKAIAGGKAAGAWVVPVKIVTSNNPAKVVVTTFIDEASNTVHIPEANVKWVVINPNRTGYYRVRYSDTTIKDVTAAMKNKEIHAIDRVIILEDMFELALSGYTSAVKVLKLLTSVSQSKSYHVWQAMDNLVHELDRYVSYASQNAYSNYQRYVLTIYQEVEQHFGCEAFDKKYHPVHEYTRFLRNHFKCCRPAKKDTRNDHCDLIMFGLILRRMAIFGHEKTTEWSKEYYIRAANDEADVPPDIYAAVSMGFIQWKPNEENLHLIFRAYRRAESLQEKEVITEGFSLFRNNTLIRKILQFAISPYVCISHTPIIMARCATTKLGRHMAWYFFKEHFAHFSREYYQNEQLLRPIFRHILQYFMSSTRLNDVQEFFKDHAFQGLQRTVDETLDCIRRNIAWARRDLGKVNHYLENLPSALLVGKPHKGGEDQDDDEDQFNYKYGGED